MGFHGGCYLPPRVGSLSSIVTSTARKTPPVDHRIHMSIMATMRRSLQSTGFLFAILSLVTMATAFHSHQEAVLTDAYLRGIMNRLGDKMADIPDGYLDYALPSYDEMMNPEMLEEVEKEYEDVDAGRMDPGEFHSGLSIRDQEFLKHSSLFSHQKPTDEENDAKPAEKTTTAPGKDIHLALSRHYLNFVFNINQAAAAATATVITFLFSFQIYIKSASLYNSNLMGGMMVALLNCWPVGEAYTHWAKYTY